MGYEEFSVSLTNRSLRNVKTELQFLAENNIINAQQFATILQQLPTDASLSSATHNLPTNALNGLSLSNAARNQTPNAPAPVSQNTHNEKQPHLFTESTNAAPPPAYGTPGPPPAPTTSVLTYAVSLYQYNATDTGDLSLMPNDRIAVVEYMNAEWWKGRNERTGAEGIFPRSYVRVEEKSIAGTSQPSNYGNAPLDVSQGAVGPDGDKKKGTAAKLGGKLGNAAIFGAGATIGSNIVNSIF